VATTIYKIPPTNKHPEGINLATENKIMYKNSKYFYEGAEGGKTGYTVQSRFSYVACASKNGERLIATFVHDENKSYYTDVKALFDFGFKNFELVKLYNKGDFVANFSQGDFQMPLIASEDYYYVREKLSDDKPQYTILSADLKDKSFNKGDLVAEASMSMKDKQLSNLKLASGINHELKTAPFITNSASVLKLNNNKYFFYIAGISTIAVLVSLYTLIKKRRNKRNSRLYK
jgi:D-alanyl-D-alanine carboxypeptidase